ncbi:Long-chain-fatty-acid--CoA ligase [Pirellulimonas nuda]|uniref:Long-chain-fatty-acid--CoA ligase n=1 Tax=Pirellulimonas nuda TaxID=2528009 RepID=A0A518DGW1_9BACT|nr:fatty acid CoA ligase family protein [Pirellulimonas nuda]QDU90708.1 Long-chain-fatty-acid--CoA ligase [Pirellulimonas nuda]
MPSLAEPPTNVADRLAVLAGSRGDAIAVVQCARRGGRSITFAELDADATAIARGLAAMGVGRGDRIALLVRPGVEFVTLVFALLRSGAAMVLVDAGLGKQNIVRCLQAARPDGFVAIPQGQALRVALRGRFRDARKNVTVGRRWFWGGETLQGVRTAGQSGSLPPTSADEPAAIVFTSGSTGPPKGVLYTHRTFVTQAEEIERQYGLTAGGVDLACFPLFGLFNVACGVTTVFPQMDFSRPASCDPRKLLAAANVWKCTQAFASPAVWDRLGRHCERTGQSIPTLRSVFSCGAPVPAPVIRRSLACVHPEARLHTPYGATEALPVATIEAQEILSETAEKAAEGAGVCVGRRFDTIDWRIIRITDDPIRVIDQAEELPLGELGELIVRGPQVSLTYLGEPKASEPGVAPERSIHNAIAKIGDGPVVWHRMGDVGYFDPEQRFWYCGRKSQRVVTTAGTLFTECVEARFNAIAGVARSALVGVGDRPNQTPVVIVELEPGAPEAVVREELRALVGSDTQLGMIVNILFHHKLPTDVRHNSKIQREKLSLWAAQRLEA